MNSICDNVFGDIGDSNTMFAIQLMFLVHITSS